MLLGQITKQDLMNRGWTARQMERLPPPRERDVAYGVIHYWDVAVVVSIEKRLGIGRRI